IADTDSHSWWPTLVGSACPIVPVAGGWPTIGTQNLTASVTDYDQTFTPSANVGDWTEAGTITVDELPLGLEAAVVYSDERGTLPSVHITGTPERDGTSTVRLSATDGLGAIRYVDVEFVVAAPTCSEDSEYHD